MILAGDEALRTQRGNNNGYCQDNELSWFDWTLTEKNREMLRFVTKMIAFRKRHHCLMRRHFLTGKKKEDLPFPDVTWHGTKLSEPLWNDPDAQIMAYTLGRQKEGEEDLHIVFNMSDQVVEMPLPSLSGRTWYRAIDTGKPSSGDILEPSEQPRIKESFYRVSSHSVVVFESR
jgi:glycogen operon protein